MISVDDMSDLREVSRFLGADGYTDTDMEEPPPFSHEKYGVSLYKLQWQGSSC